MSYINSKCFDARMAKSAILCTATHQQSCRFTHFFRPFVYALNCGINCATIHKWYTTPVQEIRKTNQHLSSSKTVIYYFSLCPSLLIVCTNIRESQGTSRLQYSFTDHKRCLSM